MKRPLFLAAMGLAAVLACASSASATHSNGTGPKKDLVAGTGTLVVPDPFPQDPLVHVNADRDPVTGEVHGHWFVRYPTTTPTGAFDMRGEVTCVDVVGTYPANQATVIGRIDRVKGVSPFAGGAGFVEGNFFQIRLRDLGEPGTLDGANFGPGQATPPSCFDKGGELPLSQGNYIAHNEPPLELLSTLDLLLAEIEAAAGDH